MVVTFEWILYMGNVSLNRIPYRWLQRFFQRCNRVYAFMSNEET